MNDTEERLVLARMRHKRCGWCDYRFNAIDLRVWVREEHGAVLCERCATAAPREIVLYYGRGDSPAEETK